LQSRLEEFFRGRKALENGKSAVTKHFLIRKVKRRSTN